jgi:hypothetical protein
VSRATRCIGCPKSKNVLSTQSYRPYGTGRLLGRSQAINCLATIIQSLRDNNRHYLSTFSNPNHSARQDSRTRTTTRTRTKFPLSIDLWPEVPRKQKVHRLGRRQFFVEDRIHRVNNRGFDLGSAG